MVLALKVHVSTPVYLGQIRMSWLNPKVGSAFGFWLLLFAFAFAFPNQSKNLLFPFKSCSLVFILLLEGGNPRGTKAPEA